MSRTVKTLDSTSGTLFMIGLVSSKLRFIPVPIFSSVIGLFSLGCYLTGYLLWLIACKFYAHYPKMSQAWFGFLPIRQQLLIAASTGLIAISLCFAALSLPVLGVAGSYLFAISNLFWTIAEYHRFKNPPSKAINPHYSHQIQTYYLSYAILATIASIMGALVLTTSFFLAAMPAAITLATIATVASTLLCLAAFYFLYKSFTYPKPPLAQQNERDEPFATDQPSSSYEQILQNSGRILAKSEIPDVPLDSTNEIQTTPATVSTQTRPITTPPIPPMSLLTF